MPETRKPADFEKKLLDIISNVIGGEVVYENEKFLVRKKDGFKIDFEMENRTPINCRQSPKFSKYFDTLWKELGVNEK